MSYNSTTPPPPIDGTVFNRSVVKTVGQMVLLAFLGFLGVCMFLGPITNKERDLPIGQIGIGIALALMAPVVILRLVRACWVRQRVVIGPDCLQMVEHKGGDATVVLHISYSNIAEFTYEENLLALAIDLHSLDDPDTYAPGENFDANKWQPVGHASAVGNWLGHKMGWRGLTHKGYHFTIGVGYKPGPRAMTRELEKAYRRWAEQSENSSADDPI